MNPVPANSETRCGHRLFGVLLAVSIIGGCAANTIVSKRVGDGHIREQNLRFFLGGVVGHETIDLDAICPQGFARIRDLTTFLDGFLSVVTLAIYTPRTAEIECARRGGGFDEGPRPGPVAPAPGLAAPASGSAAPAPGKAAPGTPIWDDMQKEEATHGH